MAYTRKEHQEEQRRLTAHRDEMTKYPLSRIEIAQWKVMLSGLDNAEGKTEQLRVCRELLRHAPDDDMLDSDTRIIVAAITQLEEELSRETTVHPPRRRRNHYVRTFVRPGTDPDDDGDGDEDADSDARGVIDIDGDDDLLD